MDIKIELLGDEIAELIRYNLNKLEIDANEIAQTTAISVLEEIKAVINNTELNDFMMIDKIVGIFYKYGIDINGTHDF